MLEKVRPKVKVPKDQHIQAMENPIAAIFDLADEMAEQLPFIRRMIMFSGLFITVWLAVNFALILVMLGTNFIIFMVLVAFFIIGSLGLYLMYTLHQFFEYFGRRQHAIRTIRDAEELVFIPKGKSSAESYIKHLRKESKTLDNFVAVDPHALHVPVILMGASGVSYQFDAYVQRQVTRHAGLFLKDAGYAFFVKVFKRPPTLMEMQALERAVQDVTTRTGQAPSRIVALVETPGEVTLDDDVYSHVTDQKLVLYASGRKVAVNLQVVATDEDGTYDFVPKIAVVPDELP